MKQITGKTYINWYEGMLLWRKFEDKLAAAYIQQKIRGFLHLYNGQEAILAGCLHAIEIGKDRMISSYRSHVHSIGLGTFTWANGEKYVGEHKNGKGQGQGTYTYPNGDKYVGKYKDGNQIRQSTKLRFL